MKKHIVAVLIFFCSAGVFAQELNLPIQNQYVAESDFLLAAAYAGIGPCWELRTSGIAYWTGIEDAPNTQSISFNGKVTDNMGIGATLFNDQNGYTSQRGAVLSYAYHLTLSQYNRQYLSFGLSYRFTQFSIDDSEFNTPNYVGDPALYDNSPIYNSNFDVSVLYRLQDFFFSVNLLNMVPKDIENFNIKEPEQLGNLYFYTGYTFKLDRSDMEIEPSIFYQRFLNDGRASLDVNIKVRKEIDRNYYWAGINMRLLGDQTFKPRYVAPMLGAQIGKFYVGYSYQMGVNELFQYSNGSHMITLGFDFFCWASECGCML